MNQIVEKKIESIKRKMQGHFHSVNVISGLLEIISIQQEMIEGLAKSRDEINDKLRSLSVIHTKYGGGGYQPSKDLDLIGKEFPSGGSDVVPPKTKPIICNVNVVSLNGEKW